MVILVCAAADHEGQRQRQQRPARLHYFRASGSPYGEHTVQLAGTLLALR